MIHSMIAQNSGHRDPQTAFLLNNKFDNRGNADNPTKLVDHWTLHDGAHCYAPNPGWYTYPEGGWYIVLWNSDSFSQTFEVYDDCVAYLSATLNLVYSPNRSLLVYIDGVHIGTLVGQPNAKTVQTLNNISLTAGTHTVLLQRYSNGLGWFGLTVDDVYMFKQ